MRDKKGKKNQLSRGSQSLGREKKASDARAKCICG